MFNKPHLNLLHDKHRLLHPILVNPNQVHQESLGRNDKIAKVLTSVYGSMYFVYGIMVLTAGWILWQGWLSGQPFDPYPFAFYLFCGNLIQLFGGPIIQVGSNLASRRAEVKIEQDHILAQDSWTRLNQVLSDLETLKTRLGVDSEPEQKDVA